MTCRIIVVALLMLCLATPAPAAEPASEAHVPAGTYHLDPYHSSLTFRVSHMGFSRYTGGFEHFDATLVFDPRDVAAARVEATIDLASLRIPAPPEGFRAELLGQQWLNAVTFPKMTFRSTSVTPRGDAGAEIAGMLTLNGVSQPVVLSATFNGGYAGNAYDPAARIGFSAKGTLKRSGFGISLGIPEPGSNMGVGDEVSFEIEAEFNGPPAVDPGG